VTRFVVELDAGGELVALQQNLETSSSDVLAFRDGEWVWRGVRLTSSQCWIPRASRPRVAFES
ncbi:MAG TPA: hypothetical protein VGD55_00685, partial [Acidothermaceae bacterium]